MEPRQVTVEVFKRDRRVKIGERRILKQDHVDPTGGQGILNLYRETYPGGDGFRVEVHDTFVVRKNAMTGQNFQERYDTPYTASPRSESYWSN